jgi:transcriptional regulator GlxA family with amidase domain
MSKQQNTFRIGIPIYDGVDLLDIAAPFEIFNWMGFYWSQDPDTPTTVKVLLVAATLEQLKTRDGLTLTPDATFDDFDDDCTLDLLWVPGGAPDDLCRTMSDSDYLGFLKRQSEKALFVASVCEGALLLASAGLLDGYQATTHWAFINCLKSFNGVKVAKGHPRFVVDRNRVTGGGISSGLDEGLELVARISSYEIAKQVQAVIQYFPRPPINGDIPDSGDCPISVADCAKK